MASALPENKDGTYNWTSWLLVNVSAHRDDVKLTCQVEHDGQPAVNKSFSVKVSAHPKEQGSNTAAENTGTNERNIYIVVGVVCTLLVALLMAALYLVRIRQKKAQGSTSSTRLHEPEKNAREITQDTNDITYADLNLPKGRSLLPGRGAQQPHRVCQYSDQPAARIGGHPHLR